MRVCIFGPDMHAFERPRLQAILLPCGDTDAEVVLLTNSWGEPPSDGTHVHVTGGAATLRMRMCRWLLRDRRRARAVAPLVAWLAGNDLIEGLRAADPDIIVTLAPAWQAPLRIVARREPAQWPCVLPGDPWPSNLPRARRHYDRSARVSIVLPTYNGVRHLPESIDSCLAQTHRNLELIVVDDGSGPEVEAVVRQIHDSRLKCVRHQVNRGLAHALNTGFAIASGELLTWTSDDNSYAPGAIEEMVRFLQTYPTVDFVYAESWEVDEAGDVIRRWPTKPPTSLERDNGIGGCFLYRRAVYQVIGDYNPRTVLAEDYDYWLRVARRFTVQRLAKPLYYYRVHPASLTARHGRERIARQAASVRRANTRWSPKPRRQSRAS